MAAGLSRTRLLIKADNLKLLTGLRSFERSTHSHMLCKENLVVRVNPHSILLQPSTSTQRRYFFSSKSDDKSTEEKKTEGEEMSEAEKILTGKLAEMEEKNSELLDKYRRSLADFENLRNRMNKQVADAKIFGIQGFCKDLLEVADVLSKAVESVPEEALKAESPFLQDMRQGLQLTQSQLLKVFERHGLEQENPLGQKFDPNKHDALFQVPVPDKEPNTVVDVQKIGYILHGRTIRPAAVGVSRQ